MLPSSSSLALGIQCPHISIVLVWSYGVPTFKVFLFSKNYMGMLYIILFLEFLVALALFFIFM